MLTARPWICLDRFLNQIAISIFSFHIHPDKSRSISGWKSLLFFFLSFSTLQSVKCYVSRCFHKTTPWSKNMQMKGSKELLTCLFISHSCIASLNPVVHFNLTLPVFSFSAHPEPGCVGWDLRDHPPLTSSRLATVKVLPDVPLTQPTSESHSKALFLAWNLPKGFLSLYPSIRSEFQIRIRVYLDQLYKISIEAYLAHLAFSTKRCFIFCPLSPLSWNWVTHQR